MLSYIVEVLLGRVCTSLVRFLKQVMTQVEDGNITVKVYPIMRAHNSFDCIVTIDLEIDNLDRVSMPTKIVATFDVKHPIHGTTYSV